MDDAERFQWIKRGTFRKTETNPRTGKQYFVWSLPSIPTDKYETLEEALDRFIKRERHEEVEQGSESRNRNSV